MPNSERPSRARTSASERRRGRRPRVSLSVDAIVEQAVAILDQDGPDALTFRRLAGDLGVGVASLYWYVDDKEDLEKLCFAHAMDVFMAEREQSELESGRRSKDKRPQWQQRIRALLLAYFDTVEEHPWMAALSGATVGTDAPQVVRLWSEVGETISSLGFDDTRAFYISSTLFGHLISMSMQSMRIAYSPLRDVSREEVLGVLADRMSAYADEFPYVARLSAVMATHDEREQFLAGLDLILAGAEAEAAALKR
ncbi:TetR/AcrR family transcriptional regulator [Calidifontibacter sp. DB0510]|uniref:TetR/AcrR family transcriptional regulator n=1 Tax=Metallococcus carri TaxID=1656884 RepID=A0A967B127_9MICO|nr:TetR/AcrR family transcriptional regulator [Metallococcus carri]NHN55460.1 TetR/AcrR family transcriptional regulator [Metallococcus carri]NOP38356.1 TetR/AcrR family transcriptional regulator [Calidifontibacter sp. DB2511S]